ncbi:MAG: NFACT RNA binding domain-containing protein [Spirochaetota bacterium]
MANTLLQKPAALTDMAILTMARSGIKSKVLDIFNKKFEAEYPEMWIGEGNADEIRLDQGMSLNIFPNWKSAFSSAIAEDDFDPADGKGIIVKIKLKTPGHLPIAFLNHESEYEPPFDDHHHFYIDDTNFDIVNYPFTIKTAPRLKWTKGSPKTASSVQWLNGDPAKTAGTSQINEALTMVKSPGLEKIREKLALPPKILVIPGVSSDRSMTMLRGGTDFLAAGRYIGQKRWWNENGLIVKSGPQDIVRRPRDSSGGDDVWSIQGTPETELLYAGILRDAPEEIWSIKAGAKTAKAPYKTQEFEGWTILIGRSAADNDILSMEVAQPNDFWMHTADYPGSHVVVRNPQNLPELPENVLQEAARAAVHNSRAKGQLGVQVVVGRAADLSKPEGSAVGEIDISSYKTVKVAAAVPTPSPSIWNVPSILSEMNESATEFWYRKMKGKEIESKYALPRGLLKHLIEKESKGNPLAVSQRGARGLFQIMPVNISGFTGDPFDPRQAAHHAAKTIKEMKDKFGSYEEALAAYNWGETNLRQFGIENAPKETRKFLKFFKSKGLI